MVEVITIDNQEYEVIHQDAVAASRFIADFYEVLGRPQTPFSESGEKMMEIIIAVWEDLQPGEAKRYKRNREDYQNNELSTREQVHKRTGRSLASIPSLVYELMKKVFPEVSKYQRDDYIKLVQKYPIFRMANKV